MALVATRFPVAGSGDPFARKIAVISLVVAVVSLFFNVVKEWWRGRRIRVELTEEQIDSTPHFVVAARNDGNTPVDVNGWGFRLTSWHGRPHEVRPGTVGLIAEAGLPRTVAGGTTMSPFAWSADRVRNDAATAFARARRVKVRGFVDLSTGRTVYSKKGTITIRD